MYYNTNVLQYKCTIGIYTYKKKVDERPLSSVAWVIIPTLTTESLPKYQMIPNPTNEYFYS